MKLLKLPKRNFNEFVESLKRFGELHAPVRKGENTYVFAPIEDPSQIALEAIRTILPPKKYFYQPKTPMFNFDAQKGYSPVTAGIDRRLVLFGLHSCEINALNILDSVFAKDFRDDYYFVRRAGTAIIGLSCEPDELCFCESMDTDYVESGFDLFLSDIGDSYSVGVGSSLGDDMVIAKEDLFEKLALSDIEEYKAHSRAQKSKYTLKLDVRDLPEILDLEYQSKVWEKYGDKCLSCGSCSMVCPTCYCYNVMDIINLQADSGQRIRMWDSCLFKEHALVAGGHNFRKNRSDRLKRRYLHKQQGFVGEYGRTSCVGCGRCIQSCPAGINIVNVLTEIKGEEEDVKAASNS
jgi:sulfhydrogenase subunit beta (sulfur reductase)